MTKSLTEKWKDGELPIGNYYIRVKEQGEEKIIEHKISGSAFFYDQNVLLEIVDSVPSYDEWQSELASENELLNVQKRLEKRLEIATKALKDIVKDYDINGPCEEDCVGYYMCGIAIKALKEMEEEE